MYLLKDRFSGRRPPRSENPVFGSVPWVVASFWKTERNRPGRRKQTTKPDDQTRQEGRTTAPSTRTTDQTTKEAVSRKTTIQTTRKFSFGGRPLLWCFSVTKARHRRDFHSFHLLFLSGSRVVAHNTSSHLTSFQTRDETTQTLDHYGAPALQVDRSGHTSLHGEPALTYRRFDRSRTFCSANLWSIRRPICLPLICSCNSATLHDALDGNGHVAWEHDFGE